MTTDQAFYSAPLRASRPSLFLPSLRSWLVIGVMSALAFMLAAGKPVHAASIPVTSLDDNEVNDSVCTLREAIKAVNNHAAYRGCFAGDGNNDSLFLLSGTITLASTLPAITAPMNIFGAGYNQTIITAHSLLIKGIAVQSSVGISNLSLRNFSDSALTISAGANLYLTSATIIGAGTDNSYGGCINNAGYFFAGSVQFESCNGFRGGVLHNSGSAYLWGSTLLKSYAEHSLIWNTSSLTLDTITIGPNHVAEGAGAVINFGGNVTITGSTIAYNTMTDTRTTAASALVNDSGTMTVASSVLFGNSGGSRQCIGSITSGGYNAFDAASTCTTLTTGDRSVNDALLQPLPSPYYEAALSQKYYNLPVAAGGVGRVYLPATNSPLLRQASGFEVCGWSDQRGIGRNLDSSCDIGAVERGNALLVVGNTTLSSGDKILKTQLESLGFVVTVVLDSASASSDANGKIVVVISESVTSTKVNTKFRDVAVGVLSLEPALFDDMMMTTAANLGTVTAVTPRVTGLFTTGFSGDILFPNSTATFGWGTPTSDATRFAYLPGTNKQFAFGYTTFSPMVNGFNAPAMRAAFFTTDATVPLLSTNGLRLLQEIILWTAQAV
jgi:CSLREA domain-containing protein